MDKAKNKIREHITSYTYKSIDFHIIFHHVGGLKIEVKIGPGSILGPTVWSTQVPCLSNPRKKAQLKVLRRNLLAKMIVYDRDDPDNVFTPI